MAKNMARIENGVVVNVEWCADNTPESDVMKNPNDRPVAIGDTYENGRFYRDGTEVLTPLEEAQKLLAQYEAELADMKNALNTLGVSLDESVD